jgi:hypothetical protein
MTVVKVWRLVTNFYSGTIKQASWKHVEQEWTCIYQEGFIIKLVLEDSVILRYDATSLGNLFLLFQRNIVPLWIFRTNFIQKDSYIVRRETEISVTHMKVIRKETC